MSQPQFGAEWTPQRQNRFGQTLLHNTRFLHSAKQKELLTQNPQKPTCALGVMCIASGFALTNRTPLMFCSQKTSISVILITIRARLQRSFKPTKEETWQCYFMWNEHPQLKPQNSMHLKRRSSSSHSSWKHIHLTPTSSKQTLAGISRMWSKVTETSKRTWDAWLKSGKWGWVWSIKLYERDRSSSSEYRFDHALDWIILENRNQEITQPCTATLVHPHR